MSRLPKSIVVALCLAGCGAESGPMSSVPSFSGEDDAVYAMAGMEAESVPTSRAAKADSSGKDNQAVDGRKLIRTGYLSGTVEDYDPFRAELDTWMSAHGGYVADANLNHVAGNVGYGSLQLRVPADQLDELLAWTEGKVEVGSLSIDSQDVTEQWTDIDARLGNMKRTETRLAHLLEHETSNLADVLSVERELARVRGDIESLEGRLRVLNDQISLARLTLDISVRTAYEPSLKMTFADQITSTFGGSISAMDAFARGVVLIAVALAPWAAVGTAFFGFLLFIARFAWQRIRNPDLVG